MSATSLTFQVTLTSTGTAYDISSDKIVLVEASGSGSKIYYMVDGVTPSPITVDEAPSAIQTASSYIIPLTLTSTAATFYVNIDRIRDVLTNGSGSSVYYDAGDAEDRIYVVDETRSAIRILIAAEVASGSESVVTGITAFAGGGQASATQLSYGFNEITTVATAGDSVKLPAGVVGARVTVLNDGANAADVFPATSGTINDGSANAAISLAPGVELVFVAITATNWETSEQNISTGNIIYTGTLTEGTTTGITAFAGGGQASAVALTKTNNNVTVCATAGDSVKLIAAVAGLRQVVKNSGATALDIFPASGDSIDALAVNLAIRIQPGSTAVFFAKDATVWESNIDETITLIAPTTNSGQLVLKAADSAGNFTTTLVNASQAASRVYTIPDAGANASLVQTEGAQTINGIKTFGSGIVTPVGAVGTPSVQIGSVDTGLYQVSGTQTGFSQDGALVALYDANGFMANSVRNRVNLGTTPVGTVSIVEYGDGRDITTVLTLTNFVVGALAGAGAALAMGNIVYAYPAGQHMELVYSLSSLVLTAAGTAVATDTGLGSVIASGAVSVLSGTGTFEDRLTGQTINTAAGGGAAVSALTATTAGIGTGIALNVAGSVKNVFLNSAGTWNVDNTGNLTATGTIVLKWTIM